MIRVQCPHCKEHFDNDHWCNRIDALISWEHLIKAPAPEVSNKPRISIDPPPAKKEAKPNFVRDEWLPPSVAEPKVQNPIPAPTPIDLLSKKGAEILAEPFKGDSKADAHTTPETGAKPNPAPTKPQPEIGPDAAPQTATNDNPDEPEPPTESDADFIDNLLSPKKDKP